MDPFAERIAHVDVDAFFVEVERRRRPELIGRAVLIGGTGPRSVVAAASYEARRSGAGSAMPMAQARRLCPHAVVVPADHAEYRRVSEEVMTVLESFSPRCEQISVDEAFLEVTGLRRLYRDPREVGEAIRARVLDRVGLPASVGMATSKLVAKMASRAAKPDGLMVVTAGTELDFLHPHPVGSLWGVGEATLARLEELGVRTVGDIAALPRSTLVRRLGTSAGGTLWDLASGEDRTVVEDPAAVRSVSVEETYAADLEDADSIDRALLELADRLASRLRSQGFVASTVQAKVRFADFTTVTRSSTLGLPTATVNDLVGVARRLVEAATAGTERAVRLLGIGVTGLVEVDAPRQLGLVDDGWEALEDAVDQARARFGESAVSRARLLRAHDSPDAEEVGPGILGERPRRETPHAPR